MITRGFILLTAALPGYSVAGFRAVAKRERKPMGINRRRSHPHGSNPKVSKIWGRLSDPRIGPTRRVKKLEKLEGLGIHPMRNSGAPGSSRSLVHGALALEAFCSNPIGGCHVWDPFRNWTHHRITLRSQILRSRFSIHRPGSSPFPNPIASTTTLSRAESLSLTLPLLSSG
jgi:hypothetical protein